jgi:hypothetical protein
LISDDDRRKSRDTMTMVGSGMTSPVKSFTRRQESTPHREDSVYNHTEEFNPDQIDLMRNELEQLRCQCDLYDQTKAELIKDKEQTAEIKDEYERCMEEEQRQTNEYEKRLYEISNMNNELNRIIEEERSSYEENKRLFECEIQSLK